MKVMSISYSLLWRHHTLPARCHLSRGRRTGHFRRCDRRNVFMPKNHEVLGVEECSAWAGRWRSHVGWREKGARCAAGETWRTNSRVAIPAITTDTRSVAFPSWGVLGEMCRTFGLFRARARRLGDRPAQRRLRAPLFLANSSKRPLKIGSYGAISGHRAGLIDGSTRAMILAPQGLCLVIAGAKRLLTRRLLPGCISSQCTPRYRVSAIRSIVTSGRDPLGPVAGWGWPVRFARRDHPRRAGPPI